MTSPDQPTVAPAVPAWLDRLSAVSWRFLVVTVAAGAVITTLLAFDIVIVPVFLALLFTSALLPLVRALRRRGMGPGLSAGLGLLVLLAILLGAAAITGSALVRQSSSIGESLDRGMARLDEAGVRADLFDEGQGPHDGAASEASGQLTGLLLSGGFAVVSRVFDFVTMVLLSVFVTFFLLKDGGTMWAWCIERLAGGSSVIDATGRSSFGAIGGYVRGAAIVAGVDAVFIALGAWILGVPFPAAILVLTFILGFIPYVGAFVAGAFASLLALSSGGLGRGLAMLAVVIVVQQLETNVLQPVIMGKTTRLHPLVVALASVAGAAVGGLLGVFVAVPITAAVVAALSELRRAGFFDSTGAAASVVLSNAPPGSSTTS
jgi:predicted PurR-regulated permease PerM